MYWADWGSTKLRIESANLDGSARRVFYSGKLTPTDASSPDAAVVEMQHPFGLTIDYDTEELYW